jgi:DNA-binding MarR family transcriptional regulator
VSVVVSRLVARGLVTRSASASDARRVDISLSSNGRALARRAPRAAQAQLIEAAAKLPAKQLKSLARDLGALVEQMADGRSALER